MSFGDHLEELRRRILLALAVPLPLFLIAYFFSDTLLGWLLLPVFDVLASHNLPAELQSLSPPEILVTQLKLSVIAALVLAAPWILYQAWRFIAPGLYQHERRFVYFLIPGSFVLSIAGVALLYFGMLPLMLHVLIVIGRDFSVDAPPPDAARDPIVQRYLDEAEHIPNLTRVPEPSELELGSVFVLVPQQQLYVVTADELGAPTLELVSPIRNASIDQKFRVSWVVNFTLVLLLGITIAFQMPLVVLLLGWLGLASPQWLRAKRKYAVMVCAVVAAVITPPDALSMILMFVPLYGLYELGILLLMIAPASAVAEGRLSPVSLARRLGTRGTDKTSADKRQNRSSQTGEPAQPDGAVPRNRRKTQSRGEAADE
jgi:sec-independent protein translocase protein TatC